MSNKLVSGVLAADVADSGTLAISYPAKAQPESGVTDEGDFFLTMGHKLVMSQATLSFPKDFDITLGTSSVTVTNKTGATWLAGSPFTLQLEEPGKQVYQDGVTGNKMARTYRADTFLINLGAPDALITNGVMAVQNRTNAGALVVNGTLAVGGAVTLDRPRNVIADSGGADTAVITVTGKDEYAVTMKENITLNGTTAVSGKKAFKTITALACDAAIANTAFIGTGDVLGLPVFLPDSGNVVKDLENGTAATAGTYVAGFRTTGGHTAIAADVRGTYDPNSACDGAKVFQLVLALPDGGDRGVPQFGSF